MKELRCAKCNCIIPMGAGFFNFPTGAQCSACGINKSKAIEKAWEKDPFGLQVAARLNRLRNQNKNRK